MFKNNEINRDQVFSKTLTQIPEFKFDERVTQVFEDMIKRSVPGYELVIYLIGLYAEVFSVDKTKIYDLGCSTGVATCMVASVVKDKDIQIVAVDNSEAMINQCKTNLQQVGYEEQVTMVLDDISKTNLTNASMIILNLTLQFIEPKERYDLLNDIFNGLNSGGVLVLTEKVYFEESDLNKSMIDLHHAFKKTQGYSELEISQKRTSIENILVPDTIDQHRERLKKIGFSEVMLCFQCFNFVSFLAIK